jgi:hypothetical protein
MVFLSPLYNQLSNEQGTGVENLFNPIFYHARNIAVHPPIHSGGEIPLI